MPRDYTVIYSHPSGATATFIYQGGELSALAKGLDAEQFWVFKQVKALLLRNEENDLALASRMMSDHGFTAQVAKALPDLLAPVAPPRPAARQAAAPHEYFFRPLPDLGLAYPIFHEGTQVNEIHWREGEKPAEEPPPHKAPGVKLPVDDGQNSAPVNAFATASAVTQVSEIHWRKAHDNN